MANNKSEKSITKATSAASINLVFVILLQILAGILLAYLALDPLGDEPGTLLIYKDFLLERPIVPIVGVALLALLVWNIVTIVQFRRRPEELRVSKNLRRNIFWHYFAFWSVIATLALGLAPCLLLPADGFCFAFGLPSLLFFPLALICALVFFVIHIAQSKGTSQQDNDKSSGG